MAQHAAGASSHSSGAPTAKHGDASTYHIVPITLAAANEFVRAHHRHSRPVVGHRISIGLATDDGTLIGVGIAGRPVARALDDGRTIEILRVCVLPGSPNACSQLYAHVRRVCQLLGYGRIITYTLSREAGSSLRAIGATPEHLIVGRSWSTPSRLRTDQAVTHENKTRWRL